MPPRFQLYGGVSAWSPITLPTVTEDPWPITTSWYREVEVKHCEMFLVDNIWGSKKKLGYNMITLGGVNSDSLVTTVVFSLVVDLINSLWHSISLLSLRNGDENC
ncbi:hypothetical protein AMECASPLE_004840 [Ameca splendens]|uniref:Uncharacterized protein n=1 Tax=Ameca splendens TaxID=208324 RepID=A0ABV1A7T8_9TELE